MRQAAKAKDHAIEELEALLAWLVFEIDIGRPTQPGKMSIEYGNIQYGTPSIVKITVPKLGGIKLILYTVHEVMHAVYYQFQHKHKLGKWLDGPAREIVADSMALLVVKGMYQRWENNQQASQRWVCQDRNCNFYGMKKAWDNIFEEQKSEMAENYRKLKRSRNDATTQLERLRYVLQLFNIDGLVPES